MNSEEYLKLLYSGKHIILIQSFFHFTEGVKIKVYLKAAPYYAEDGKVHLSVRQIKMDFTVKDIKMGVDGIHQGNAVIRK